MAIVKNNFRVSKLDGELSPGCRDSLSTDEDELPRRSTASESNDDNDEDDDDADSGAGSDDFDMLELGEIGAEFCQVGNQNCCLPFELYDLPDLGEVLTLDTWNNCLTEEERFSLAEYLPDMDQETFMRTLKELFSGSNFHFGSPVAKLFNLLKGGLCEPRVALYRQGLNLFQKRQHYHLLRKYQNSMVSSLMQIKDAWENCVGYSIEERLRILNIMRSQRSLMYEKMEDLGLESGFSEQEESGEGFWGKRPKDIKLGTKAGRRAVYSVSPVLDVSSRRKSTAAEPMKYGKQNPRGTLKFSGSKASSAKEFMGHFPSAQHGLKMKSKSYLPTVAHPWQDQVVGYGYGAAHRSRGQVRGVEELDESAYEMNLQRDRHAPRGSAVAKVGSFKPGKKSEFLRGKDDFPIDDFMGLPLSVKNDSPSHGRTRYVNQRADIESLTEKVNNERASYNYHSLVAGKKAKYLGKFQKPAVEDQMKTVNDRAQHTLLKGNHIDWSSGNGSSRHNKAQEEAFSVDLPVNFDDWGVRSKKWKLGKEYQTGKNSLGSDFKVRSHRAFPTEMEDKFAYGKTVQEKIKWKSPQNGGVKREELRGINMFSQSEETESDSSEQANEEDDINLLGSKLDYPGNVLEGRRSASVKSLADPKKANKLVRKDKKEYAQGLDAMTYPSKKGSDLGEQMHTTEIEMYLSKGKYKDQIHDPMYFAAGILASNFSTSAKWVDDDRKQTHKLGKNGHLQSEPGERSHLPLSKAYPAERKQKGNYDHDHFVSQSNYMHDYISGDDDDDDLHGSHRLVDDHEHTTKSGKKGQNTETIVSNHHERSDMLLLGCSSVTKKRKGKADLTYMDEPDESGYMNSSPKQQIDGTAPLKKRGKRKVEAETGSSAMITSQPLVSERGATDVEPETKPAKKPFTLITPTVHTGFSFSIIHLLSAVRAAMITPYAEDTSEFGQHLEKKDGRQNLYKEEQARKQEGINREPSFPSHESLDVNDSDLPRQKTLPSLTVQEIVNRVRSNPGDPCILETQEPLQELVRGVLKLFSSKTAPLGAKGWKSLVFYERSTKSWSWIGPVSSNSSDHEIVEEETSSEAWGLPHRMLVKLVDAFANWLKSGQETLQQLGSLPAPPVTLMQPIQDAKERFRDLRAQKSLTTISPSSEEVRAYFRKEEQLRYSVPDRAFSYTAADGKKSIVAPLRRCGGKPTSKARDHFMLKPDRPPHVTILCLVRDAAARLPGSMGTRADVCTLIRDSQYIVEDVSDAQINQVVSGALDRLHYERDPCVQFDGDRKIWVYLHREREEEDFEDDGTSSTKKWKRQRKDATEQSYPGTVNAAYNGAGDQIGSSTAGGRDLISDLNVESSSMHERKRKELVYDDSRPNLEEDVEPFDGSAQDDAHEARPMDWEAIDLNPVRDDKMLCQENSTNEDFDDEVFSRERERPVGILAASLL